MPQNLTPQTLRRLTYFAAIADAGSIREAARRLGLSVASVSEALAALEEELGATLAVRNTRRLHLTDEGRRVERIAVRVLEAGQALFPHANDPAEVTGHVALTAPVEIAQSWLPAHLEKFKRIYPKVGISVSASDHLVDLSQSAFDIAIRARFLPPGNAGTDARQLLLTCVSSEPLKLSPRDDGWFTPVTLLAHQPSDRLVLIDRDSGARQLIRFADVTIVDNKHVALAMVTRGMGAALVSKSSVSSFPDLHECPDRFDFGNIELQTEMRDTRPSPAALALQSAISAVDPSDGSH